MNPRMSLFALSMAIGSGVLAGCVSTQQAQSPADQATAVQRIRCSADFSDATIARVLSGSAVEYVEPLYKGSASKTSNPRLQGAAIVIEPARGETAEWLDRALECHQAQQLAAMQTGETVRPDPFWLQSSSVQIEVTSARDGLRIQLIGGSIEEAHTILARAQALGAQSKQEGPTAGVR
jgi:hypothetical protein